MLQQVPESVRDRCTLGELTREYTFNEIAIITRAGPARMLGLERKGHLGEGADGDVTVYSPDDDIQRMFEIPRYVISGGEIIVDDAQLKQDRAGTTFHVQPTYDEGVVPDIKDWFEDHYTIRFRNYPVGDHYLENGEAIPTN